jgi:hypothetical protein
MGTNPDAAAMIWPSAEWELVCCCSRRADRFTGSAAAARAGELIQAGVDAGRVGRLAAVHGVAGLVGLNLCALAPADSRLRTVGHAALVRQTARNAVLMEEVGRVVGRLAAAGITVLPFKGPVMALALYGEAGARASADLDFIVRGEDLERVTEVLKAAGSQGRRVMDERVGRLHRRAGWGCELRAERSGILLEFNCVLAPGFMGFRFGAPELFAGARPQRIGPVDVLSPRGEELVLALCVHGSKHGWCRLSWLADLQAAWDASPAMDVPRLLDLARRHRLLRVVKLGHWLARRLLPGDWPPELLAAIDADDRVPGLGRRCLEILFSGRSPGVVAEWRFLSGVRDGSADRMRYAIRWVFQPSWSDWHLVRLPRTLEWGYVILRPFRLLANGCRWLLRGKRSRA